MLIKANNEKPVSLSAQRACYIALRNAGWHVRRAALSYISEQWLATKELDGKEVSVAASDFRQLLNKASPIDTEWKTRKANEWKARQKP